MKGDTNGKQTDYIDDLELYEVRPSVDTARRGYTKALSKLQKSILGQEKKVWIYGLQDPETGLIMYIGKAVNIKNRINAHLVVGYGSRGLTAWLRKLGKGGMRPIVQILEIVSSDEWPAREYCWIRHYRKLKHPLLNVNRGGLGHGCGKPKFNFEPY